MNAMPLLDNLRFMDTYLNDGYQFCFLTARGAETAVKVAIRDFLKFKDETGELKESGELYRQDISCAVGDEDIQYQGDTIAEKKCNVLKSLRGKFDNVIYVDDSFDDIECAKALNMKNPTTIVAK